MAADCIPQMHIPPLRDPTTGILLKGDNRKPIHSGEMVRKILASAGVQFQLSTRMDSGMFSQASDGNLVDFGSGKSMFNAVIMATGARQLKMTGLAMDQLSPLFTHPLNFLRDGVYGYYGHGQTLPSLEGKVVVIIGAGYTARDCASMAKRLGAAAVILVVRKPEPGEEDAIWLEAMDSRHEIERIAEAEGITVYWAHELEKIEADTVVLRSNQSNETIEIPSVSHLIPALGFDARASTAIEDLIGFRPEVSFATGDMVNGVPQTLVNAAGHAKGAVPQLLEQLTAQAKAA